MSYVSFKRIVSATLAAAMTFAGSSAQLFANTTAANAEDIMKEKQAAASFSLRALKA